MSSWAGRRRATYISVLLLVVLLIVAWILFSVLYEEPTCFDAEQNGSEEGVDCGGLCERVCQFDTVPPQVLWSRFFEIGPGFYSAIALVENPNVGAQAMDVPYAFKLRDGDGVLIVERKGAVFIPPDERVVPVFESAITAGEREVKKVFFEIEEEPVWDRGVDERLKVSVHDRVLSSENSLPRLSATIRNDNLGEVSNIEVTAILTDINGNAIAASKTKIDYMEGRTDEQVVFTWPSPLPETVATIDVIPIVVPLR